MKTGNAELAALEKRAEEGDSEAQYALGKRYYESESSREKFRKALELFHRAATEHYHIKAQFMLGLMYYEGKGTPKSYTNAMTWWRFAAERGHTEARASIGKMYALGRGVPQSYREAYIWYSLAAMDGDENIVKDRDAMEEKLPSPDLSRAQEVAVARDKEIREETSKWNTMTQRFPSLAPFSHDKADDEN